MSGGKQVHVAEDRLFKKDTVQYARRLFLGSSLTQKDAKVAPRKSLMSELFMG
jgi:hypothetical protein